MSETIAQQILIEAPAGVIFEQLCLWGESPWWPKSSLMKFSNLSGAVQEDTVYVQKVALPGGPSWHTRNSVVDKKDLYIKRVFVDGMFDGFEELRVVPPERDNSCDVIYTFTASIKGGVNRLMWGFLFRDLHTQNIDLVLKRLKAWVEKA